MSNLIEQHERNEYEMKCVVSESESLTHLE